MAILLSNTLTPTAMWIVLALIVGVWLSISWILNYHWKTYGHHISVVSRARIVYFIGSALLIITAAVLIATL